VRPIVDPEPYRYFLAVDRPADGADPRVMRIIVTAALWFLTAWVCGDITCFVLGVSREATPVFATLVGVAVASWLTRGRRATASQAIRAHSPGVAAR
jgi:hypothetical protein